MHRGESNICKALTETSDDIGRKQIMVPWTVEALASLELVNVGESKLAN